MKSIAMAKNVAANQNTASPFETSPFVKLRTAPQDDEHCDGKERCGKSKFCFILRSRPLGGVSTCLREAEAASLRRRQEDEAAPSLIYASFPCLPSGRTMAIRSPREAADMDEPTGAQIEIVAETADLRVVRITLAPGGSIPWHHHSNVDDRFFCTEGEMTVEIRAPQQIHHLTPGGECTVPAKTAHVVSNVGEQRCRFVLVQGMGAYDRVPEDAVAPTPAP